MKPARSLGTLLFAVAALAGSASAAAVATDDRLGPPLGGTAGL